MLTKINEKFSLHWIYIFSFFLVGHINVKSHICLKLTSYYYRKPVLLRTEIIALISNTNFDFICILINTPKNYTVSEIISCTICFSSVFELFWYIQHTFTLYLRFEFKLLPHTFCYCR